MSVEKERADARPAGLLNRQADEALMCRVAEGFDDAFEVLLRRYQNPIITFCYSFMRKRDVAEDMAQEVFLRVFKNAGRYRPTGKFSTWLFRIAANLCINELKKRKLRRAVSLDAPAGIDPQGSKIVARLASDEFRGPLDEAERHEAQEIIDRAIQALPEEQRATLVMVEYHRMCYKEIAEILRVTVSAIKMRVKRARESLREALKILVSEPPPPPERSEEGSKEEAARGEK